MREALIYQGFSGWYSMQTLEILVLKWYIIYKE